MATTLQLRRGTTAEANAVTGAAGELFVDLTTKTMRLHDGTTQGGNPVGGGSMVFLSEISTAGAASVDFTSNITSTYDTYVLKAWCWAGTPGNSPQFYFRVRSGGVYVETNAYKTSATSTNTSTNAIEVEHSSTNTVIPITPSNRQPSSYSSSPIQITMEIRYSSPYIVVTGTAAHQDFSTRYVISHFTAGSQSVGSFDGIRAYTSSGNIVGTFRLYGIKKS
jgi:hypothetical protein